MHLDPEIAAGLAAVTASQNRSVTSIDSYEDILAARAQIARTAELWNGKLDRSGVETELRDIPGPAGAPGLQLRIHRPKGGAANLHALYFIHGGGMVAGDFTHVDGNLLPLVRDLGCIATSVTYRIAPEHPAPAATEDCCAGLEFVMRNAATLGMDASRIALGGISGGGGIAATTAIMARDRGILPCLQYLIYPQLDERRHWSSAQADFPGWTRGMNEGAWRAVLGDRYETDRVTPYDAASRATDLAGLPPAYIDAGAMEVFRDPVIDYAARLLAAGVQTELHIWPGACHGFDLFAPNAAISRMAVAARRGALRRAWGLPPA